MKWSPWSTMVGAVAEIDEIKAIKIKTSPNKEDIKQNRRPKRGETILLFIYLILSTSR
jgi:hypothetical protein